MNEYNKLVFQIQQWPEGLKKVLTADFTENTVAVRIPAAGVLKCKQYPLRVMQKLFNRIQECHPESWKKDYDSPIPDGIIWQLQLFCGEKAVCESRGFNRFPENWKQFAENFQDFLKIA